MEALRALLILIQILVPAARAFGVNPVQCGLIMILTESGAPIGVVLFVTARILNISYQAISRTILPWFVSLLLACFNWGPAAFDDLAALYESLRSTICLISDIAEILCTPCKDSHADMGSTALVDCSLIGGDPMARAERISRLRIWLAGASARAAVPHRSNDLPREVPR